MPLLRSLPGNVTVEMNLRLWAAAQAILNGLLVGITEDMPPDRWQHSCRSIMDGLERHAREKPELYQ